MSERGKLAIVGSMTVATLTCFGWILVCPHRTECLRAVTQVDTWLAQGARVAIPIVGVSLAAWFLCLIWLLTRAAVEVGRLAKAPELPPALVEAMARTGARRVTCLAAAAPAAFCAGALRPRVLVSLGLVGHFGAGELDAILLHEQDHARRFEPLIRAAHDAAVHVFFYIPLVRWWSRKRIEDSELRADRAALDKLGPRPVAAALWALDRSTALRGAAAFGGVAELRVAQVLGDPIPRRVPGLSIVAISAMGAYLAFEVASCLVQAAQHLV